jgi:predicted PurR-regulated permease PerM
VSEPALYAPRTRKWALVALVVVAFIGAIAVVSPLWIAIVLGTVLAISAHRPYRILCRRLGGRSSLAAGIVTFAAGLLVAFAGSSLLIALANELMKLVAHLNQHGGTGSLSGLIGDRAVSAVERMGIDTAKLYLWAQKQLEAAASFLASTAAVVVRTTSEALLGLIVALMTMYYMLIEGPGIAARIERVAPLEPRHTRALLAEVRDVAHAVFIGTIATAMVQGALAGIGYAVLGVPQPMLWAAATALASFLPVVGTLLVWIPVAGYLLVEGHTIRAIVMVAWGVLVVTSLADYVVRPRIVGRHGHGHPLLTLIALLGGIEVFGLAGLIIGPIIMSTFVAAFRLYEREVKLGGVPGTTTEAAITPRREELAAPQDAATRAP